MPEVWFIRHGESTANAGHVVFDTAVVELTEKGHEQAKAASLAFTASPDLIVVTPYLRTQQTARYTQERFPHVPCETWDIQEFAPLSYANYRNTTQSQRSPLVREYWEKGDPHHVDGEGAESFAAMTMRLKTALEKLSARPEKFVAVFTHGHVMRTLRFLLAHPEWDLARIMLEMTDHSGIVPVPNCAVIRVHADSKGASLSLQDLELFHEARKAKQAA